MIKQPTRLVYQLAIMAMVLLIISSCNKKEDTSSSTKKDPVITWANPADIVIGTLLSTSQLSATASVPGTLVYTPAIGTKLGVGASQDLKVLFTPTDMVAYNSASKTVKINVISPFSTITDIDGNIYSTLIIGTQVWMLENLKTTRYNDGSEIPLVSDAAAWGALTPGYCWYNNDSATYKKPYGALYNWYAVNTGKLAPTGWHVATDADWTTLTGHFGGDSVAGGKMKTTGTIEAGTGLWHAPNALATNESGFSAVPAGFRDKNGAFDAIGFASFWRSSSEFSTEYAWSRTIFSSSYFTRVLRNAPAKNIGYSVRCVRN